MGILVRPLFTVVVNLEWNHSWKAIYNLLFCGKSLRRFWFFKNNYDASGMLQSLAAVFSKITTTNIAALIVGSTCIVLLLIGKEINLRFKKKLPVPIPMEIIVVSQLGNSVTKLYSYSKAVETVSCSVLSHWAWEWLPLNIIHLNLNPVEGLDSLRIKNWNAHMESKKSQRRIKKQFKHHLVLYSNG